MRNKYKKKRNRPEFQTVEQLREFIRERLNRQMEGEVPHGLPKAEREKYGIQMKRLRKALRECIYGDEGEKNYLKSCLKQEILQLGLSFEEMDRLFPIGNPGRLSTARKFDILLYLEMKQKGKDAFLSLCERYGLPREVIEADGAYYEITGEMVEEIYHMEAPFLSEEDRKNLFCDYVYEGFGHGIIDRLRSCRLDGISGGVAGLPAQFFRYEEELYGAADGTHAYDSVFVMLKGTTVRMSFLSFGSERELKRVTKALLRYEAPGELTYYNPYMVNDMKDGSRVFACRPPFSESWAFFVRKFDTAEQKRPEELILGEGAPRMIRALRYFVGRGLHIAISGAQGSGKTTLLKALVRYINPKYNLRIEESVFELWMRKEFPKRNILTFRETDSVGLTEGLDAFRKTDGNCLMMGEIGTIQVAALMVELSQVSEQQLFTHHAMSTGKLVDYFQNALLRTGAFSDERMAREQVLSAFQIHLLCERALDGRRYIREVTEIIPLEGKYRVLFRFENGSYHMVEEPTQALLLRMGQGMEPEERREMFEFFGGGKKQSLDIA